MGFVSHSCVVGCLYYKLILFSLTYSTCIQGSAEVVFSRRTDAFQALKRYNNVQLDGRPMKIEIIGTNSEIPSSARVNVVGGANGRRTVVMAYVLFSYFLIILLFLDNFLLWS